MPIIFASKDQITFKIRAGKRMADKGYIITGIEEYRSFRKERRVKNERKFNITKCLIYVVRSHCKVVESGKS